MWIRTYPFGFPFGLYFFEGIHGVALYYTHEK